MNPGFHGFFYKAAITIIKELRKRNESKIGKIQSKTIVILYDFFTCGYV